MSEGALSLLEILGTAEKSEELKRNISTAALLWAASSLVAFIMHQLGRLTTYQDALPAIVLITWLGSEIAARIPRRIPVSICPRCRRISSLPTQPLRRLWPWRRCVYCGGALRFSCPNNHLLSLFSNEPLAIQLKATDTMIPLRGPGIWCSRCGEAARSLSSQEFFGYWDLLYSYSPQPDDFYKLMAALSEKWVPSKDNKLVTPEEFSKYFKLLLGKCPDQTDDYELLRLVWSRKGSTARYLGNSDKFFRFLEDIIDDKSDLKRAVGPFIREFKRVDALPVSELPRCPACSAYVHGGSSTCAKCHHHWPPFYTRGVCPNCYSACETVQCYKCDEITPFLDWQPTQPDSDWLEDV